MNRTELTDLIMDTKRERGLTWAVIADTLGLSEVFTTSACLGMNAFPADKAEALAAHLELPDGSARLLAEPPTKIFAQSIPTDPCIYRFHEIVGVYGRTLKELIQERGGDGIMSAIDFDMSVEKVPNPKGDRIEVRMSGKFLPYNVW